MATSVGCNWDELKKRIAQRKEFLAKILAFANSFIFEHGTVTDQSWGAGSSNIARELKDFNDFKFIWRLGANNSILISYPLYKDRGPVVVFSMDYRSDDLSNCQVRTFIEEGSWEGLLLGTMSCADRFWAEMMDKRTQAEKQAEEAQKRQKECDVLVAEAKRLKLIT